MVWLIIGPGKPIENRALTPMPSIYDGWAGLAQLTKYVDDRIPLRSQAVLIDATIDEKVFREDAVFGAGATPRVISGKSGLLFLSDAIDATCRLGNTVGEVGSRLSALDNVLSSASKDVLIMVAPDKSTIHPELLPSSYSGMDSFMVKNANFWDMLLSARIKHYIDLRSLLLTETANSRELLYLRKDSHWDNAGSLVAVRAAINRFQRGLWTESDVIYRGQGEYVGDLTHLQGRPTVDFAPVVVVERKGVTVKSIEPLDARPEHINKRYICQGPPGSLISGRTVLFLDSFGMAALPQIVPFFENISIIRLADFNVDEYVDYMANADRIWILSVERSTPSRVIDQIGSDVFIDRLKAKLSK